MARQHLNPGLLAKMTEKTRRSKKYLREQISRKANRLSISSAAAQVVWAKELGISTTNVLNALPMEIRDEVRTAISTVRPVPARRRGDNGSTKAKRQIEPINAAAINALLQDEQLRDRCKDLLRVKKHFDRVIREATTVLDDRLKKKSGIANMKPEDLVGKALNPDPQKAVIEVSSEQTEQRGFHNICNGIMLAFRHKAHHTLSENLTREDALKFCGFVDTILKVIQQAKIHPDRV